MKTLNRFYTTCMLLLSAYGGGGFAPSSLYIIPPRFSLNRIAWTDDTRGGGARSARVPTVAAADKDLNHNACWVGAG